MLSALFGHSEQAPNFEQMAAQIARDLELPEALLDPRMAVDTLLQRYPELESAIVARHRGRRAGDRHAPARAGRL